jgi:Mrp family chromosome partitioning ATPase
MSKNFELLQRTEKSDLLNLTVVPEPLPGKAHAGFPFKIASQNVEICGLVHRLFPQAIEGIGPKVVSFSGITREDRSSWICARAAEALAQQTGDSVCIVETNLKMPQLQVQQSATNRIGLAEALTMKDPIRDFATPLPGENLWLISSGISKLGFYASMERYRERFAELRESFDYVLVSAPPVNRETEATRIGQLSDGVVLIVEANHTRRETVRRAKERLESAQVRILGAVLDQRTFPIPEGLYRRL